MKRLDENGVLKILRSIEALNFQDGNLMIKFIDNPKSFSVSEFEPGSFIYEVLDSIEFHMAREKVTLQ